MKRGNTKYPDWMDQFPSTTLRHVYRGNREITSLYEGAARALLGRVKNAKRLGTLGSHRMTRVLRDGTLLDAKSIFGQDQITIDVTRRAEVRCSILLFDLPEIIPPMINPGIVLPGDVEGIDYVKTYYLINKGECLECGDAEFTVCNSEQITEDDPDDLQCTPFKFDDPDVESKEGEYGNHCIESSSADDAIYDCQAEIIDLGSDDDGPYFRWKAYTEWQPAPGDGHGFLIFSGLIRAFGKEICSTPSVVIEVDCCQKNEQAYKDVHPEWGTYNLSYTSLFMTCSESQNLEVEFACLPISWSLSGPGTLVQDEDDPTKAIYTAPGTNPNCQTATITVEDGCGSSDDITIGINCGGTPGEAAYRKWTWVARDLSFWCQGGDIVEIHNMNPSGSGWKVGYQYYDCLGDPVGSWIQVIQYVGVIGALPQMSLHQEMETVSAWVLTGCIIDNGNYICCPAGCGSPPLEYKWDLRYCDFSAYNGGNGVYHNFVEDTRTQEQKDAGCCPPELP